MASQDIYFLVFPSLYNSLRYWQAQWLVFHQYKSGKQVEFHICDEVVTAVSTLITKPIVNILIYNWKILLAGFDEATCFGEAHMARWSFRLTRIVVLRTRFSEALKDSLTLYNWALKWTLLPIIFKCILSSNWQPAWCLVKNPKAEAQEKMCSKSGPSETFKWHSIHT